MDWTEAEIRLIIKDYFSMLQKQMRNIAYNKSEHRRALVAKIGRSEGSVEFKHRNISAVLDILGFETLNGYLPAKNYQNLLATILEEEIYSANFVPQEEAESTFSFAEPAQLFAEAPPSKLSLPSTTPEYIQRLARKFDPARRDLLNRQLGIAGEKMIFDREVDLLVKSGRADLAKRVEWTSQERGDGTGYDIRSFRSDGKEKFIEVKTTNGSKQTPFYISDNELEFSREAKERYTLNRLFDFRKGAKLYELNSPLEEFVLLSPAVYRAGFGDT
jgi:hypothetical protein